MRYDLYSFTEISSLTFLFEYIGIYPACREIGKFIQIFINESFIVT